MLVDGGLDFNAGSIGQQARQLQEEGYNAAWATEAGHDPLLTLAQAAPVTDRLQLGTAITVALARSPMITATLANDLQLLSKGRLLLGLGSQVRPHIEQRYSMPWSQPAARMREYVTALHAIWSSWNDGMKLEFRGDFYTHTLMTPFFSPRPSPYGAPQVFLAAVGERMAEIAGEVCDGLLIHGFTTPRYLRDVTLPALERGLAKARRRRESFTVGYAGFVVTGDEAEREASQIKVRRRLAFYASTPAYKGVLDVHGWGALQPELNSLAKQGRWEEMPELITDDILERFAITAPGGEVAQQIRERFGDLVDRFIFQSPPSADPVVRAEIISGFESR